MAIKGPSASSVFTILTDAETPEKKHPEPVAPKKIKEEKVSVPEPVKEKPQPKEVVVESKSTEKIDYEEEKWVTASVSIAVKNSNFLRKVSRYKRIRQKDFVVNIIDKAYRKERGDMDWEKALDFDTARRKRRSDDEEKIKFNLSLPKTLMDFVMDYAVMNDTSRSAYVDSLLTKERETFLKDHK